MRQADAANSWPVFRLFSRSSGTLGENAAWRCQIGKSCRVRAGIDSNAL